ncbi:MFS transporter [Thaumasiovibrio subtropicus]|uniref:MFS transporter n=1 Tax=Thaumasiovibrio subtropicus TaxID=1891207 RepID=UPI000B35A9B3|nr:MFS transporter [Thaumasiovibrio subtropicus]
MKNKTPPYLTGRFFDGISSGMMMMALPWIILKAGDMGSFIALTALTCTAASFILTPFTATLLDRVSRKGVLISVQLLQSSTAAGVLAFTFIGDVSVWLLAFAQFVFWLSSNVAWNANNAFTQENYEKHEYAKISGQQEIILQGTTLGSGALGIVLLEMWGIAEFALFAMLASAISATSYALTPYNRKLRQQRKTKFLAQIKESKAIFIAQPTFYGFILLSCLTYPILTYLGKLVPIWFAQENVAGHWLAVYNITFAVGSLVSGLLISRILRTFSHQRTMFYGMAMVTLVLFAMSSVSSPIYIVLFTAGFGVFNAANRIARTTWMHNTVAIETRGRVDGGLAMFSTLAQSLSYVLIALLAHYNAIEYGFLIMAVVITIATLLMMVLLGKLEATPDLVTDNP